LTYGLATGSKIKVLGSSTYLITTTYYDNKGRVSQSLSDNINGGEDRVTSQYDFSGKILSTYLVHIFRPEFDTVKVLTKMLYDQAGRLLKVWKQINDSGTDKQIVENTYDELGELKTKKLAPYYNSNAGLETLTYEYNIRGWLKAINKDYAGATSSTNWFGQTLSYDYGFSAQQYNGNIAGVQWRSKGDGERRAYGFTYDAVNRFMKGDFTQYTSSAWNNSAGIDFTVKDMSYDANGNILTMSQKGWKLGGSSVIDSLVYGYNTSSNKLNYVTDKANDANSKLGDFKETTNNTSQDYSYDGNGNMTIDNNKAIGNIHYNFLNLPDSITVTSKGTIKYTYDAAGNKLKKTVVEGSVTTTTKYIAG
jgi:YD repeat-containing protein